MNENTEKHQLSPQTKKVKLISEMIGNLIGVLIIGILFWLYDYFSWPEWMFWALIILIILTVLGIIWSFMEAKYLYENWEYALDGEYLYLTYGIIKMHWVTIPMSKVQGVSANQGPILRKFKLRSITVETMGSSHTIPYLEEETAMELKEELATYAKLKEVDD